MNELWRLDAVRIAALVKSRQVSARDVAAAALERLSAVNPSINAVVDMRPGDVLAQAGRIDAAIARGEETGALAGVPVTVKVNVDQKGYATTNGVTLQKDLLAADNSPVVDSLLEAAGYTVLVANDGQQAWDVLQTEPVDAVVSDVNMPRMDGIALCRAIRTSSRLASLPVVLVTSLHTDTDRRAGLDAGADAYLTKVGFNRGDLLDALERLL